MGRTCELCTSPNPIGKFNTRQGGWLRFCKECYPRVFSMSLPIEFYYSFLKSLDAETLRREPV